MLTHLIGFGVGGGQPFSYSYLGNTSSGTDASTYTFSSFPLGSEDSSRQIVITIEGGDAGSGSVVSSATFAGVSATQVIGDTSNNSENRVEIWKASVPSGTTGTIVINWAGTKSQCGIAGYALYSAGASAADTDASASAVTTSHTASLDIPAGGCVIAAGGFASATATWTNANEDFDFTVEGPQQFTGASQSYASAQTNLTITMTTSSSVSAAMCCASFGAA